MKKRITGLLLALCLCLALLPAAAFAEESAAEKTADFTGAAEGGAEAALALLNAAKWNNAENSTWDSSTKTLTLKGINFTTTATTALKLPAGATIVLADGTHNTIQGGDATVDQTDEHLNHIYIYGIYADGALTIQGETNGTGTLSVTSGAHINSGDAWTYSVALYAKGDLTVKGGEVTATGGKASSADCAFSHGVELAEGSSLFVTGGSLTGIGGESVDTGDEEEHESFSRGFDVYRGNISVSGAGQLDGKTIPSMETGGLSWGVYLLHGNLSVSDQAQLKAAGGNDALTVSGGALKLTGGKISAVAKSVNAAISVTRDYNFGTGNIEVSGGILEAIDGGIYMYQSNASEQQGLFKVSGGRVTTPSIYGANKLIVSSGTMATGWINANDVDLSNGSLTIREPVYQNEYTKTLYASHALYCKNLTVSGGTLNAAWDWGNFTPAVFPEDSYWGYAEPLIKILSGAANFNGGSTTLDTGCAGNTALKVETLNLGTGILGSGYTHEESSDTYLQEDGSVPVRFGAYQPVSVSISDITAQDKVYDGTDTAALTGGTLNGVETGNDVEFTMIGVTAKFADKAVGTKAVTVTGSFRLTGEDAYKYALTQPDLSGLTASITASGAFTDATNQAQTIYVGEDSFEAPRFTGIGGETVEGALEYHLADGKTEADISAMLRGLKAGESLYIPYAFTASGNYSGTKTGIITVTAQNRPSSGGSSSPSYSITLPDTEHGTVTANRRYAERGDTVTITVKPDSGYQLGNLTATDKNGNDLKITDKGNGKYTFTMPIGKVEVKATFAEEVVTSPFTDVATDAYYYEAVKWAAENGITGGTGGGLFSPDSTCTRAQIVTFLWRAAGSPEPKNMSSFSDVPEDSYYAKAVAWAVENGITVGTSSTTFTPDATCTRAQSVTFLFRAAKASADGAPTFRDVAANAYYAKAVKWGTDNGITNGIGGGLFGSNNDCTRAQIVTFLWRLYIGK